MKLIKALILTLSALLLTGCYTQLKYSQSMTDDSTVHQEEEVVEYDEYIPVYYKDYAYAERYGKYSFNHHFSDFSYHSFHFNSPRYYDPYFSSHYWSLSPYWRWRLRTGFGHYYGHNSFAFSFSWGSPFYHSFFGNSYYYDPYWYGYHHRPYAYNYYNFYGQPSRAYYNYSRNRIDDDRRYGRRSAGVGTNRVRSRTDSNNGRSGTSVRSRSSDTSNTNVRQRSNSSSRTRSTVEQGNTRSRSNSGSVGNTTRTRSSGNNGSSSRSRSRDDNMQQQSSNNSAVRVSRVGFQTSDNNDNDKRDRNVRVVRRSNALGSSPSTSPQRSNRQLKRNDNRRNDSQSSGFIKKLRNAVEKGTVRLSNSNNSSSSKTKIRSRSSKSSSSGNNSSVRKRSRSSSSSSGSVSRSRSSSSSKSGSRSRSGSSSRSRSGGN